MDEDLINNLFLAMLTEVKEYIIMTKNRVKLKIHPNRINNRKYHK